MSGGAFLLEVENLSVHLAAREGTVRAVDRISLAVERGKTLALVGESGCGKSMLCRALAGVLPPAAAVSGAARLVLDGRDLGGLSPAELARLRGREIGMVLQNPIAALNPVHSIGSQVSEPMLYHLGISRSEGRRRATELLRAVGIPRAEERFACYPHQLSGGMRQRVAIAIALSCDPKLLIADEPTTALDVTVQAEILNLLGRLQKERGMSILLVSHDLALVAGRADDTAVMYAGRIVEQAPTRVLFARMRMHYTRALFDALPRIDAPVHGPLKAIGGQPPDLSKPVSGCAFASRCKWVRARCNEEEPPLVNDTGNGGRIVAPTDVSIPKEAVASAGPPPLPADLQPLDGTGHRYACWFPAGEGQR